MTNLDMYEGEDLDWIITVTDSDGAAIDITGYTFLFTVKKYINDSDDNAIISKDITSHTSPTTGVTTLSLDREDTIGHIGSYVYDIQWNDDSDKRRVILGGRFTIKQVVTDRSV